MSRPGPARPLARPAGFASRKVPSLRSAHFAPRLPHPTLHGHGSPRKRRRSPAAKAVTEAGDPDMGGNDVRRGGGAKTNAAVAVRQWSRSFLRRCSGLHHTAHVRGATVAAAAAGGVGVRGRGARSESVAMRGQAKCRGTRVGELPRHALWRFAAAPLWLFNADCPAVDRAAIAR